MEERLEQRFWAKVKKGACNECWEWQASTSRGYGQLSSKHGSAPYKAHRVSWQIHNGPIPREAYILHHCDNPACVNPKHLYIGTHQDNMRDMSSRDRAHKTGHSGESNGQAILEWKDIYEIRDRFLNNPNLTATHLQQSYNVGRAMVGKILGNKAWYDPEYDPTLWLAKPNMPPRHQGESHPQSKLTRSQVQEIRKQAGKKSWRELALEYGVSKTAIGYIITFRTWKET